MNINTFVEQFAEQFDDTDREEFTPTTTFKDLEEWSSLSALLIIAMIDENYDVIIKGDDIMNSSSIEDLFKVVESRK
jgi:acyl carrier protein